MVPWTDVISKIDRDRVKERKTVLSLEELVRGCREGNKAAWDELFVRFVRLIVETIEDTLPEAIRQNKERVEEIYGRFVEKLLSDPEPLRDLRSPHALSAYLRVSARHHTKA